MSENNNVRLGLIELYKNKIRFLGFTQKDLDEKYNSSIIVQPMEKPDADQLLDELDEDLCSMLTDSGVLLAGVHRLLMHEGYCHE